MGLNNRQALRVVFDIETIPLPDAADYIDTSNFAAPSNWKDPVKIAANIEEQKQAAISKAALDLDLCQVVAIGWMQEGWNEPVMVVAEKPSEEAPMIREFWDALDERVTVGKNSIGFDLPVLLRRSLYLGVQAPMLNIDKYRSPHIDLQLRLTHHGAFKFRSLDFYCKRFGIVVEDGFSGKDIGALVEAKNWYAVKAHCRADVLKTKALAEKMGLLKQQPAMQEAAF